MSPVALPKGELMTMENKKHFHKTLYECLGQVIHARRKRLNMSQEQLASEADVDRAFISKIEGGKRQPSFGLVASIAEGLRLSFSHLVNKCEKCAENVKNSDSSATDKS